MSVYNWQLQTIPRFIPFEYLQTTYHSLLEYSRIWPIISTSVKSFYYLSLSYYWNATGWNTRRHLCFIRLWINLLSQCCFSVVSLSGACTITWHTHPYTYKTKCLNTTIFGKQLLTQFTEQITFSISIILQ